MKSCISLGAMVALIIAGSASADSINLGWFRKAGLGNIEYQGDFAQFITSTQEGDTGQYNLIRVDLVGLLNSINADGFNAATIVDTGENAYNGAPGADIDLLGFEGLGAEVGVSYSYDGPNELHQGESQEDLFQRASQLDWGTGGGGLEEMTFVSLDNQGALTASLSETVWLDNSAGEQVIDLLFAEAGSPESFFVYVETVAVPTPGALALLGVAGLLANRRRRRHA